MSEPPQNFDPETFDFSNAIFLSMCADFLHDGHLNILDTGARYGTFPQLTSRVLWSLNFFWFFAGSAQWSCCS